MRNPVPCGLMLFVIAVACLTFPIPHGKVQAAGGTFTDLGSIKVAHAGAKHCNFYGSVAPWGVEVVCYGANGEIDQIQATQSGKAMQGGNDDNSVTWIIGADRTFHIAILDTEKDGSF